MFVFKNKIIAFSYKMQSGNYKLPGLNASELQIPPNA